MAKTAKLKKKQQPAPHSRAARRALSPTDPSLVKSTTTNTTQRSTSPTDASTAKPHILAAKNAGIQKRASKNGKQLTRAQRQRQLKGMERAEHNMDKLEVKVMKSVGKEKKVKERSKGWEEVNSGPGRKKGAKVRGLDDGEEETGKRGSKWAFDEEMEEDGAGGGAAQDEGGDVQVGGEVKEMSVVVPESVPLPAAELEDELL
ncbi:hypothetical protein DM02DRAFT_612950 [Periconia macrospinosa]|uniref:Ribosome biogenesis protein Alb1 n=1 Tax=Periconia macrospinosa TaxID=97972 RepID=A0A2V1DWH9_9PLEO|nr:hypothetical protein DM02DRAFT_612950 [Periconia macrospinosa]